MKLATSSLRNDRAPRALFLRVAVAAAALSAASTGATTARGQGVVGSGGFGVVCRPVPGVIDVRLYLAALIGGLGEASTGGMPCEANQDRYGQFFSTVCRGEASAAVVLDLARGLVDWNLRWDFGGDDLTATERVAHAIARVPHEFAAQRLELTAIAEDLICRFGLVGPSAPMSFSPDLVPDELGNRYCNVTQVGWRIDPETGPAANSPIVFDASMWQELTEDQRAGFLLHEAVLQFARVRQLRDLSIVHRLTALLAASDDQAHTAAITEILSEIR